MVLCLAFFSFSKSYALEDLTNDPSATEHYISDDGYTEVPLDFGYPFYGRTFTNSWMFANGVIGFLSPSNYPHRFCCTGLDNTDPSYDGSVNFTLMPLQTDLINYGDGKFMTRGDENSMTYGWYNISEYGRPNSSNTFEAEIFADGMYEFRYGDLDVARGVTIGSTGDPSLGQYEQYLYGVLPPNGIETITSYGLGGICVGNPLVDPNCPGYADAYAQQQYEQNCAADPLYDPGCPRYSEAYLTYQCSENVLYDSSCPGYQQAFAEQQLDRTCSANPQSDPRCSGYTESSTEIADAEVTEPTTNGYTDEPELTGDSTIDSILREGSETMAAMTRVPEPAPMPAVEPVGIENRSTDESDQNESTEEASNGEEQSPDRRKKLKEIAEQEARDLANKMSQAGSVEQQMATQARVMSLISYVPGFGSYAQKGIPQPANYYSDESIYEDRTMPDSNFGARNGLAQEILHERMVQMQYGD